MKIKKFIIIVAVFSLVTAIIYPLLVEWMYEIGEKHPVIMTNFDQTDTLSYGGTIIGSVIAGAVTLLGVLFTILAQREDQKEENKRLVMPMLKISTDEYDYKHKYIQFDTYLTEESKKRKRKNIADTKSLTIKVTNIGQRELLEMYVGDFSGTFFAEGGHYYKLNPVVYSGDAISLNLCFYENGVYDNDQDQGNLGLLISPMECRFYFKDCLGNWYSQDFAIRFFHSITKGVPAEHSALNISIERIEIRSAPELVANETLPWIIDESKIVYCA